MKKLLIAVNSELVSEDLKMRLFSRFEIQCCHNGTQALSTLNDFRPDVVLIDLMLSDLDGITVLKAANAAGIYPRVIALSDYISSYIVQALEQLDVCSLFRYASDMRAVTARIIELGEDSKALSSDRANARNLLAVLGFNMNSSGTSITEIALDLYRKNPSQTLSHELYSAVAALCNGSPAQVERAIRTSIESAWKNRNEEVWRLYFALGKAGNVSKPTNADFLARISGCMENISSSSKQKEKRQKHVG